MVNKSSTKIWMDIYNKPTRYVPFTSNHPRHCSTNIRFSLASVICIIVENENVNEKRFSEQKKNIASTKILSKSLIEARILRAKEIPL